MGYMQSLGSIGGMIGNIVGTIMYKFSKDTGGRRRFIDGQSLPFVVLAFLMAVLSMTIWQLEEPPKIVAKADVEGGITSVEDSKEDRPDGGCCLTLRQTTYDPKLD